MRSIENKIAKIHDLKKSSGTHSPSIATIKSLIPDLNIKIDGCFLSNPYATEYFMSNLNEDLIQNEKLRDYLEFYPSQNNIISKKISEFINLSDDMIFVGNGAIEIIQAVMHNFISGKVFLNTPTFSSYYEFINSETQVILNPSLRENDFKNDINNIIENVKKNDCEALILINPNNPTGSYYSKQEIITILDNLKHLETIIIDESFIHFAYEDDDLNLISYYDLAENYPNLIIIKSMSKDFGIAGIRAGYGVMSSDRKNRLLNNGYLWNSNGLSEYFFQLYTDKNFQKNYESLRKKYIIETKEFQNSLREIKNIKVYESKANFVLVELPANLNADDFVFKLLIEHGVYTRTCSDKIGLDGEFVRVASRSLSENKEIIKALKKML